MRLKMCDSHLTCKVSNKCLNVRKRMEVVKWNKKRSPNFPCCPVSCQCPWKKTLIRKYTNLDYVSSKLSLTYRVNVNQKQSVLHSYLLCLCGNREYSRGFQNKIVSSSFEWVPKHILFLAKLKREERSLWNGKA